MSNNANEVNKKIFDRLKQYVPTDLHHYIVSDSDDMRRIKTTSEERDIVIKGKIEDEVAVFPNKIVRKIRYRNTLTGVEKYFITIPDTRDDIGVQPFMRGVVGSFLDNSKNEQSKLLTEDPGLLTLIWGNSENYPLNKEAYNGSYLVERIFGHKGFIEYENLKPLFEDCEIWEVEEDTYSKNAFCIYGAWLTNEKDKLTLDFSEETLTKYRQLFEEGFGEIVGEPLLRSLTSTHYLHSFLECYRCIERLYHIPYVEQLLEHTKDDITTSRLAATIEAKLGWRPKEEEALGKLIGLLELPQLNKDIFDQFFESNHPPDLPYKSEEIENLATMLSDSLRDKFRTSLEEAATKELGAFDLTEVPGLFAQVINNELPKIVIKKDEPKQIASNITKEIYRLRNSVAHWRPSGDSFKKPRDWNTFIGLTCGLVFGLYKKFESGL